MFLFSNHNNTFEQLHGEHEATIEIEKPKGNGKEDTYTPMLEDYLTGCDAPKQLPSPARRSSKPRPANVPVQCPVVQIQEQIETIDLSGPLSKPRKPPVPPRPAPRKRVKGILKNRHDIAEQLPVEATVEPFFSRTHHTASVRERRHAPHSKVSGKKSSGYMSEMDPNKKCCSKRLRRTRSTDLVR